MSLSYRSITVMVDIILPRIVELIQRAPDVSMLIEVYKIGSEQLEAGFLEMNQVEFHFHKIIFGKRRQ